MDKIWFQPLEFGEKRGMCNLVGIISKDKVLDVRMYCTKRSEGGFKEPKDSVNCIEVEPDTAVQTWYCLVLFVEWRNKEIAYMKQSKTKFYGNCWQSRYKINLKTASSGSW